MIHCVALIANVLKFFFMEGLGYKPTASTKGAFMGWKGILVGSLVGWGLGSVGTGQGNQGRLKLIWSLQLQLPTNFQLDWLAF